MGAREQLADVAATCGSSIISRMTAAKRGDPQWSTSLSSVMALTQLHRKVRSAQSETMSPNSPATIRGMKVLRDVRSLARALLFSCKARMMNQLTIMSEGSSMEPRCNIWPFSNLTEPVDDEHHTESSGASD